MEIIETIRYSLAEGTMLEEAAKNGRVQGAYGEIWIKALVGLFKLHEEEA